METKKLMGDTETVKILLKEHLKELKKNLENDIYIPTFSWFDFDTPFTSNIIDLRHVERIQLSCVGEGNVVYRYKVEFYLKSGIFPIFIPANLYDDIDGADVVFYVWKCWLSYHGVKSN